MIRIFFLVLMMLTFSAQANISLGIQALQVRDYGKAFQYLQPAALSGDVEAQFQMCGLYFNGLGVPINDAEAFKWCMAAAKQGHMDGAYNTGLMYMNGDGVGQNIIQAEYWFKQAASKGHSDASFNLEQIYNSNRQFDVKIEAQKKKQEFLRQTGAVSPNVPISATVLIPKPQPMAMQARPPVPAQVFTGGYPSAANQARKFYPQQAKNAPQQFQSAPVRSPSSPQSNYAIAPQERNSPPTRNDAIALQNQRKQAACMQAIQAGIIPANCFQDTADTGVTSQTTQRIANIAPPPNNVASPLARDSSEGDFSQVEWLTEQVKKGDIVATNNLGVMYRRGKGVAKNEETAFKLFEQGAAKGSVKAILNLASMYKLGEGTEQNLELAYAWFNLAADRMDDGSLKDNARENVKEISGFLSNEQIGSALAYINELDESIPMYKEELTP